MEEERSIPEGVYVHRNLYLQFSEVVDAVASFAEAANLSKGAILDEIRKRLTDENYEFPLTYVVVQQDADGDIAHVEIGDEMPEWKEYDVPDGWKETIFAGYMNGGDSSIERTLVGTWIPERDEPTPLWDR